MTRALAVVGLGAVTPVGVRVSTACAALRAGVSRLVETPFIHFSMEPIIGGVVPFLASLDESDDRRVRVVSMAATAVREALEDARIHDVSRTALLLGVAEAHRGHGDREDLLHDVESSLGVHFHDSSRVIAAGNTSVVEGLGIGRALLARGDVEFCVIAGSDSFVNVTDLQRLESCYRLRRPGIAQGVTPGEAAGALLVTQSSRSLHVEPRGYIRGLGLSREDEATTVLSEGHPTGRGLHGALSAAIEDAQGLAEGHVSWRLSDINGEAYSGIDSTLAMGLFYRTHRPHLEIVHPADRIGEVGAAVGALLVSYALMAMAKEYAEGPIAMCETSAESGTRACAVVSGRY